MSNNDELILMMAFRGHMYDCVHRFYDDRKMEINAVVALCEFALNHDLRDSDAANELLSYIKAKGYTEEVR